MSVGCVCKAKHLILCYQLEKKYVVLVSRQVSLT